MIRHILLLNLTILVYCAQRYKVNIEAISSEKLLAFKETSSNSIKNDLLKDLYKILSDAEANILEEKKV